MNRSLNGIGRTDIQVNDDPEREILTPKTAELALRAIDAIRPTIDRSRAERGSIEGDYLDLGTHYGHPAIRLRERKSGAEVWCWVSENDLERFSELVRRLMCGVINGFERAGKFITIPMATCCMLKREMYGCPTLEK